MPDPQRQLEAYRQSAATLNLLRAFSEGGYASLDNVLRWLLDFEQKTPAGKKYREMGEQIQTALRFMRSCGVTEETVPALGRTSFYTSHESLLLNYEQALVRRDEAGGSQNWYAHLRPHAVDRRPHAPARSRARGVPARHQKPDRRQVRAHAGARRA